LHPTWPTIVGRVVFRSRVKVDNPLLPFENTGGLPALRLPMPGRYAVRLPYNGLVADEFSVETMEQP
jgi:hypothetical protein